MAALLAAPLEAGGDRSIEDAIRDMVARIGEKIVLRRFEVVRSSGGRVGAYVHGGRIGVLVDLADADDAVGKDVAMHVAASSPLAISESDMPTEVLDKEREIMLAQIADSGKPPEIIEKMVEGRLRKHLSGITLLGQPFVKDGDVTVEKLLQQRDARKRQPAQSAFDARAHAFVRRLNTAILSDNDGQRDAFDFVGQRGLKE